MTPIPADIDVRVLALVSAGEPPASRRDLKKVFLGRDGGVELLKWRGEYLQFYVREIDGELKVIGPVIPATTKRGCPLAWYDRFKSVEDLFVACRAAQARINEGDS